MEREKKIFLMWGSLLDCINVMISEVALFLSQLESHCFVVVHLMFALYAAQSTGERGRREVAWSHEKGVPRLHSDSTTHV